MKLLTNSMSSASVVSSKRKKLRPILAAATAVGAQLLFRAGVMAAPPAPELDYATAYGDSGGTTMYVQWYTDNYTDPDLVNMTFYWGTNSTVINSGAYWYGGDCSAAETSKTLFDGNSYNSGNEYEAGVQAYDDSGSSGISWIGATNE